MVETRVSSPGVLMEIDFSKYKLWEAVYLTNYPVEGELPKSSESNGQGAGFGYGCGFGSGCGIGSYYGFGCGSRYGFRECLECGEEHPSWGHGCGVGSSDGAGHGRGIYCCVKRI